MGLTLNTEQVQAVAEFTKQCKEIDDMALRHVIGFIEEEQGSEEGTDYDPAYTKLLLDIAKEVQKTRIVA